MNRKVDLHIHSYASDGEWSAEEVIKQIDDHNIKIFAVCDHDEIGCISELAALTKDRKDLDYIKAVEISVLHNGIEHHILTYGIDENDEALQDLLRYNIKARDRYNDKLVVFLSETYPQISMEAYEAYDYNPYQGGWRTLSYLIDNGVVTDLWDFFKKIKGFKCDKRFHMPEVLIPKLNQLGYKTILAHPPMYTEGDLLPVSELNYFRELGVQGIECYTQYLKDQSNAKYYLDYCEQYDMLITGGSDCHGGFAGRRLGHPDVTEEMIKL